MVHLIIHIVNTSVIPIISLEQYLNPNLYTIPNIEKICVSFAVQYISLNEPLHEISNNVVCATSRASDQPAHTRSLIRAFASRLNIL